MFDKYSVYSQMAGDFKTACDDKVLVDLNRLNSMDDFDEIDKYITKVFGSVDNQKVLNYPNDVRVTIKKDESEIIVIALKGEKPILCKGWQIHPD